MIYSRKIFVFFVILIAAALYLVGCSTPHSSIPPFLTGEPHNIETK